MQRGGGMWVPWAPSQNTAVSSVVLVVCLLPEGSPHHFVKALWQENPRAAAQAPWELPGEFLSLWVQTMAVQPHFIPIQRTNCNTHNGTTAAASLGKADPSTQGGLGFILMINEKNEWEQNKE